MDAGEDRDRNSREASGTAATHNGPEEMGGGAPRGDADVGSKSCEDGEAEANAGDGVPRRDGT